MQAPSLRVQKWIWVRKCETVNLVIWAIVRLYFLLVRILFLLFNVVCKNYRRDSSLEGRPQGVAQVLGLHHGLDDNKLSMVHIVTPSKFESHAQNFHCPVNIVYAKW